MNVFAKLVTPRGDEIDAGSYTPNVASMWTLALTSVVRRDVGERLGQATGDPTYLTLFDLNWRVAGEVVDLLDAAVRHMRDPANAGAYLGMTPRNHWGSHNGAAAFLEVILDRCREHPEARIEIGG